MKNIFVLTLVLFVSNVFGSPLIFSVSKEITTKGAVELATIDTAKFRQIRIGIKAAGKTETTPDNNRLTLRGIELKAELAALLQNYKESNPQVITKRQEIFDNNSELARLANAKPVITISAIENGDEIPLMILDENEISESLVIDSPPTKLKVSVSGQGKFALYVWGQ